MEKIELIVCDMCGESFDSEDMESPIQEDLHYCQDCMREYLEDIYG